jgi:hypothetical protein
MAAGSSTTVSGGAITAKSLTHEGGTNTIAAGSAVAVTDLTVTGGTLNAANSTLTVSKQAIIGETVVATMLGDGPAFGVSGSDVLAAQTLTLNGGVMTVEGVVIGGAAIPETGLMAHYKFDETSGTVAENASNPGTIDGAMESATGWFNDATRGQVLKFEGGDDSVQITPAAGFSEEITIGMWVSVDGAQATYGSLTHHDNWGGGSVHYQFRAGNRVDFPVNGGRGDNTYLSEYAFAGANENKWTHLVATYSSTNADGEFKYYIDGVAEPVIPTNDRSINMSGFDIGSWNGDRDFVGMMDDYVIYDVALTPEQVGDLFTATSAGFVPGDPAVSLADTTLHAASSSTVAISGAQGSPVLLGGITTDESTVLTINSAAANINLTNMTLGGGSMVLSSTATSGASDVTMTVSGTLTGGNSTADIGEMPAILPDEIDGDSGAINLTLTDTSTYEWTFVGGADTNVDVTGLITMEAGATINLNYGSGSITDGTVKLFRSYLDEFSIAGLTTDDIDLSLANINITTSAGMVLETGATLAWSDYIEDPNIGEEFIYLTLTGVSTDVVVVDQDGDADNDQDVDEADMAVLLAQFGSPHSTTRAIDDNADFNGDGYVDMADFVILRANWGAGTPAPGATDLPGTTPEPTTMSLLAIGALVALRRRRRKA